MRITSAAAHRRRSPTFAAAAGWAVVAILAGCTPDDRPAVSDWNEQWKEARLLVPTEREFVDGGRIDCDRLVGQLRVELPELTPTPAESIDPVLDAWSDHLRTLAFECPADRTEFDEALSTIHQLEAEIDAALG